MKKNAWENVRGNGRKLRESERACKVECKSDFEWRVEERKLAWKHPGLLSWLRKFLRKVWQGSGEVLEPKSPIQSPISSRKEPAFAVLSHCLGAACGKGSRGARAVMNFDGCQSQQQLEALGQSHSQPVEDWNPSDGCHSLWFIQKLVWKTCCLYATDGNVFKILRKHLVGQILISNDYNFQNAGCRLCGWSHRRNSIWGMGWILFFCIWCEQFYKPKKAYKVW